MAFPGIKNVTLPPDWKRIPSTGRGGGRRFDFGSAPWNRRNPEIPVSDSVWRLAASLVGVSARRTGSRELILRYLLARVGQVVTSKELQKASGGVAEWARRVRELRDEQGYQILSNRDRADLKPGQYILASEVRLPELARSMSKETRAFVLERNGYTCQSCGLAAADQDPFNPARKVRLTLGHIVEKSHGGSDSPENLRAICTNCNEGLQNIAPARASLKQLLTVVRRAPVDDQLKVLEWLERKYAHVRRPT